MLIWTAVTVPAITISVLMAHLLFHPGFSVSWTIIPVYLLMVVSCFGIGYGYSFVLPAEPAMVSSQVIAFTALMFSPINFRSSGCPNGWQSRHMALPPYHMAEVMRASLASATFQAEAISYVVLAVWAVLGFAGAIRFLERA